MKFDAYSATIADSPRAVVAAICEDFGQPLQVCAAKPMHGYESCAELVGEDRLTHVRVLHGGRNGKPHAFTKGEDTEAFVRCVRARWPRSHHVTRFDAAEDFDGAGVFERLQAIALRVADKARIKVSDIGDFHRKIDGRTQYYGSAQCDVRVRLYEKGKQLIGQYIPASPDWARLENQVRPQKEARVWAATASPAEVWGCSEWTRQLAIEALAVEVPRVIMQPHKASDDERAMRWMCEQYGGLLSRVKFDVGDWACVGIELGRVVEEVKQQRSERGRFRERKRSAGKGG